MKEDSFTFRELCEYGRIEDVLALVRLVKEASIRRQDYQSAADYRDMETALRQGGQSALKAFLAPPKKGAKK